MSWFKVYVLFEHFHPDVPDHVVELDDDEWELLIAPAIEHGVEINTSTVDQTIYNEIKNRPPIKEDDLPWAPYVLPAAEDVKNAQE